MMKYRVLLMALLLSVVTAAVAQSYRVNIGTMTNGSITASSTAASGATVTLTVTPADGYYIEAKDIVVTPSGDVAQAPTRTPSINIKVEAEKEGDGSITPEGRGNFKFTMPKSNVTITATFHARTDISGSTTLTLTDNTPTYDGEEHKATVASVVYSSNALKGTGDASTTNGLQEYDAATFPSIDYINAGTKTVSVALRGKYMGTVTATYNIGKRSISVKAKDQTIAYGSGIVSSAEYVEVPPSPATQLVAGHTITSVSITCTAVEGSTQGTDGKTYPTADTYSKVLTVTPGTVVIKDGSGKDMSANYTTTVGTDELKGNLTIGGYEITDATIVTFDTNENTFSYDRSPHSATVRVYQGGTTDSPKNFITPTQYDITYTGTGTTTYAETTTAPTDAGTYSVGIKAKAGASISGSKSDVGTLTIKPIVITATVDDVSKVYTEDVPTTFTATYTGYIPAFSAEDPEPASITIASGGTATVSGGSHTITGGTISTAATYSSPAGTYPITFSTPPTVDYNNYTIETKNGTLTVTKLPLGLATITISNTEQTYTGSALAPTVTVTGYNNIGIPASNYTLKYEDGKVDTNGNTNRYDQAVNAGTYTVFISATESGSVSGEREIGTLTIKPKQVSTASEEITIEAAPCVYDGTPKEPATLTVKDGGTTIATSNYTATYSNNVNAGSEARVTLTMQGNYEGTVVRTYTISPRPVKVTAKAQTIVEGEVIRTGDGTAQASAVDGTAESGLVTGHTLKSASVSTSQTTVGTYADGIAVSGAWIVSGETDVTANYAVTYVSGQLTIVTKNPNITIDDIPAREYNGDAHVPTPVVKNGSETLAASAYAVTYENNTDAGTGRVVVTLNAPLEGSTTKEFTITPKAVTITAKDQNVAYGSAVSSSPSTDVTVERLLTGHTLTSITLTPATTDAGSDIPLVPSLAAISDGSRDVTGNYAITYVNGKVNIATKTYTDLTATVSAVIYNGQAQTPAPEVTYTVDEKTIVLEADKDYTLAYTDNTAANTTVDDTAMGGSLAKVTITLKGNYSGTIAKEFKIYQLPVNVKAVEQTITTGNLATGIAYASLNGQVPGHVLGGITLTTAQTEVGYYSDGITVSDATINDGSGNNVTANYYISFMEGPLTIIDAATGYTISTPENVVYTGSAITPAVTVKKGTTTLTEGTGYTLRYQGNVNVGTAQVIAVIPPNANSGEALLSASFNITARSITVTPKAQTVSYGGTISTDANQVEVSGTDGLASGHRIGSVVLSTDKTTPGDYTGAITASNACIVDASGADVTQNYTIAYGAAADLTIGAKPYSANTFTLEVEGGSSYPYKGEAYTPDVTVKDGNKTLVKDTDYTLAYADNVNAGTATVTVSFTGNYSGTATTTFTITKRRLTVTPKEQTIGYNTGGPRMTAADLSDIVTVEGLIAGHTLAGVTLTSDKTDMGVYPSGIQATAATVKDATDADVSQNYEVVTAYGKLTIQQKDYGSNSNDFTFEGISDQTYNGSAQTPAVVVKDQGQTLTAGTDYSVSYSSNENVGTATVSISFTGNYSGSASTTFRIVPKAATVTAVDQSMTFGESIKTDLNWATLSGQVSGHTLGAVTIATTTTSAGSHSGAITVSGARIMAGSSDVTANYTISYVPASLTILQKAGAALTVEPIADYPYTSTAVEPSATVKDGSKTLVRGTDYDQSYENNVNAGTARTIITLKGNYSGSLTQTFTITKLKLTVTAKDQTITYGETVPSEPGNVTASGQAGGHSISAVTLTPSITEVGEGTLMPSVAAVSDGTDDVTANYDIEYKAGKLTIVQKASDNLSATIVPTEYVYNGQAREPAVTVKDGDKTLSQGTDYTVAYENNTDAGTAQAVITLKGNYQGSIVCRFNIAPLAVTVKAKSQTIVYGATIATGAAQAELSGQAFGHVLADVTLTAYRTEAGTYADGITVTGAVIKAGDKDVTPNYTITYEAGSLTIQSQSSDNLTVDDVDAATYTGSAIQPAVTVRDGDKVLKAGTDYDVTYADNINAGEAKAIVTLKGNYQGTVTKAFTINKKAVTITAKPQTITYGAAVASVADNVSAEGLVSGHSVTAITLTPSTDQQTDGATVTPSAATISDAQGANVTANYTITYAEGTLTILQKASDGLTATLEAQSFVYSGQPIEPKVTVKDGDRELVEGTDYDIRYENNTETGLGTAVIVFKGNYSGALTPTFTITPRPVSITAKGQTVDYGTPIATGLEQIIANGLVSGHTVTALTLTPSTDQPTGSGQITPSAATISDGQGRDVTGNYTVTYTDGLLIIRGKEVEQDGAKVVIDYGEDGTPEGRVIDIDGDQPTVTIPETVIGPDGQEVPVKVIDPEAFKGKEDIHDIYLTPKYELDIIDPTFGGWATPEKRARVHVYQTLLKTYAEGQLAVLVKDGLLVTDIESVNRLFTFSNAYNTILPEGVRQHTCYVEDNGVHMHEVQSDVIARETGVLLVGNPGLHIFVATTQENSPLLYDGNQLLPVMESEHISQVDLAYLLTVNEFKKMNLNNSIPDGKAYLQWPDPATYDAAPARLQIVSDGTSLNEELRMKNLLPPTVGMT